MGKRIDQWLAFIDDEDEEMVKMAEQKNVTLRKAREEMNYLTGDAATRRLAELKERWDLDYNSGINYARREGEKQGRAKGQKQGLARGRKQGLEEGRRKTAKELLKLKVELETIIKATGLTKEEIEKLKEE